ncbi:MAG: glycosyltransferase family 39 protein [Bellilinea sp.]|jgi:hypothetical protein
MNSSLNMGVRLAWGLALWAAFTLGIYLLFLQPASALSLRRLAIGAAVGLGLLVVIIGWLAARHKENIRQLLTPGWISANAWLTGLLFSLALFAFFPAPRPHLFAWTGEATLSLTLEGGQDGVAQITWMNNGIGDISFRDLNLPENAHITPQGLVVNLRVGDTAEIRWRGRIWERFLVTVTADQPTGVTLRVSGREISRQIEAGNAEHVLQAAYPSGWYPWLVYLLVIGLGAVGLGWLAQVGLRLNLHHRKTEEGLAAAFRGGEAWLPYAALAAVAVFYGLTFRAGHPWGDDFAQYIAHARNIVNGLPYTDIGIIHNPAIVLGPSAYPPLFPLLLAPLVALFGIHLTAFKILGVVCALGALALFERWLRRHFNPVMRALIVALAGFSPLFWSYKEQILSDMPFVFFTMLAVLLIERLKEEGGGRWGGWLAGLAMGAAVAARSVGVVLWIAFILEQILQRRWRRRWFGQAAGAALSVIIALNLLLPSTGDYLGQTAGWNWAVIQYNLETIEVAANYLWASDPTLWGVFSFTSLVAMVLFAVGFFRRPRPAPNTGLRESIGLIEWYFAGHLAIILIWPHPQGMRFFLPLMFFYLYYVFLGLKYTFSTATGFKNMRARQLGLVAAIALALALTLSPAENFWKNYAKLPLRAFDAGVGLPASQEMFTYARDSIADGQVVAFFKPRALALLSGKTAFAPHWQPAQPEQTLADLREYQADYLIVWKVDYAHLADFARQNSQWFTLVFENADFDIFTFTGAP